MTHLIDRCINLLKWPIAIAMLINTPFLFGELVELLALCWTMKKDFFIGLAVYITMWRLLFSSRILGAWLPTLVHESIHAFFAILTGHSVIDFSVRWKGGGHITYAGGVGNWLISVSPYFVPFTLLVFWGCEQIWPILPQWRTYMIGCVFGFEIVYVWRQVHCRQTDLTDVGWPFTILFLPGALMLSYTLTLSLVMFDGFDNMAIFQKMYINTLDYLILGASLILQVIER